MELKKIYTKYSYKAWWFNPSFQKKQLTSYSSKFDTLEEVKEWYDKFGSSLEKRFNRVLVLVEDTYREKVLHSSRTLKYRSDTN